ncbi:MAG: PAS domain S-box protein [Pseudomonadota bacterium]
MDPVPILLAGATVVLGWIGLLLAAVFNNVEVTGSYREHITTDKLLIGANIEMAMGFAAVTGALVATAIYARRILANTADIEELELATRQAKDIAARHAALFETSSDGIVVVDQFGIVQRVNPALETMFGHSAESLVGRSVAMLMSQQNAEKLAHDIQEFQDDRPSRLVGSPFESEGLHADGRIFPIELSISDFEIEEKLHFTGIIRDVTSRVQSRLNERAALTKFEEVVTSALDAIVVIDEQGMIVEFNPAAEEIFGFKSQDVIGKDMGQTIIPEHHRAAHANGMAHYLKTGEGPVLNQRIEIDAVTADHRSIMIELAIKEWANEDGSLFFGYMRDITEKKAREAELVEAKERAEVANRAKASFLAMMSHEIRTPLNGVLGILSLLSESSKQPENAKLIATARRSGKSLLTIINDILDFSKLEAGKLDLEVGSFHTELLVDSVQSLVRQQANQKGLKLSFVTDDDVPRILLGDQDRIRQILLNLVWNAIKFTETGSVDVALENCGTIGAPCIRFSVVDSGVGVPEDRRDELFAEFATIDPSYARKFGGTGLGLSICKALTDAMGGKIGYAKNSNAGSTFWFELPLPEGDENTIRDEETGESAGSVLADLDTVRLLLAEDNGTNQLVVGNMLERLGCVVDIVSNGQEAVDGLLARDYDAILMDVSMPEMDGIAATKIIRSMDGEKGKTPIIALTAYALDEDRQRVLAAGMNDFVAKPISRVELARAIARQVTSARDLKGSAPFPSDDAQQALFDDKVLNSILADMDDETSARVLTELDKDIRRHLVSMKEAVAAFDVDAFERATHGIKGVSGTFGATELARISSRANTKARKEDAGSAFEMVAEIETLALATLKSVQQRFTNSEATREAQST